MRLTGQNILLRFLQVMPIDVIGKPIPCSVLHVGLEDAQQATQEASYTGWWKDGMESKTSTG